MSLTEAQLEEVALNWFRELGYQVLGAEEMIPSAQGERASPSDVVLVGRLRAALWRHNPGMPESAREEALRKVLFPESASLVANNRRFHQFLCEGVDVEYQRPDGSTKGDKARLIDFAEPANNDFLAVNQFTVVEGQHKRRPDIVVFVNGLPLGLIELKNAVDENTTIWDAYKQVQTYKQELGGLLGYNEVLVLSDGFQARIGSLTANQEWFKVWRTIEGDKEAPKTALESEILIRGVFDKSRFLDLLRHFVTFEEDPDSGKVHKIIAAYHQFHAVNAAVAETVRASGMANPWKEGVAEVAGTAWAGRMNSGKDGDRRAGVVWHTQGSGKSFSMLFYAARVIKQPEMLNPTVVVLTDRNDLDDQLFGQFLRCHEILRQKPQQANDRNHLRELLQVASGGVIFSTMQKFRPDTAPSPQPSPRGRGSEQVHYRGGYDFSGLVERARELRRQQTPAEAMLWELIRNRQLQGAKFRRQHQLGDYICDFFCAEAKLVLECDGEVHHNIDNQKHDAKRDAYLRSQGMTVLRFPNAEVQHEPEKVLHSITAHLPSPPGRGAGGEGRSMRMPCLSERSNIVVIADEAHRSQYDLIDGLARNLRDALPKASFIGFTGTPIESNDANTRAIFGDYISIYDIQRAVVDGATVPIYYESRIAKLALNQAELPKLDEEFEEITEGEEETEKQKLKSKWAAIEALVGSPKRLDLIAADLVAHYEKRSEAVEGKAMVVCMSRTICVELYEAIIRLRPEWASAKDDNLETERGKDCVVKIVMTGSADDGPEWQPHIRNKQRRRELASRFKDSKDPFRIVIVRDMWLTGFDAPCLSTMYADKPMRGHGLMQAIARVNRVFRDKPGGLVVDYLGLADQLKQALATYTESGGKGTPQVDTAQAIAVMEEKHGILCDLLHGFDWSAWAGGSPAQQLALIPPAQEHVLELEKGKERFCALVTELSRAFSLCAASDAATEIRDDIAFFQAIKAQLAKNSVSERSPDELNRAVRQLVSSAIMADEGIIDVFTAAGLKKPDISILSDKFLTEVRGLKHKNVAAELLAKLLKGEVKSFSRQNLVKSQQFSDMLLKTLNAYHNRAIATHEVLEELIKLAKEIDEAAKRGHELGLNSDELAFYDALAANESALQAMKSDDLKVIAAELVTAVRKNVTIDWNLREGARATIRLLVKKILKKHGFPPDLAEESTQLVLKQAEVLCAEWV